MSKVHAVVLAGSRPGGDPFARANGVAVKALIPVDGMPMVARPVRTLLDSRQVADVLVLAQEPGILAPALPTRRKRLTLARSGGTIASTLERMLADPFTRYPLLVTTADHALLTPAMLAQFIAESAGADLAIGLVERGPLLQRLPDTKRTWIAMKGGAYSGANLFAFGSPRAAAAVGLWREVEQDRKKGWKLLAALGIPGLLGLLRLRTLGEVLDAVGRRLGLTIRAVEMTDPIAAVDVDKPTDLALAEAILKGEA